MVEVGLIQSGKPLQAKVPSQHHYKVHGYQTWAHWEARAIRDAGHHMSRGKLTLGEAGQSSRILPHGPTSVLWVPGQFKRWVF